MNYSLLKEKFDITAEEKENSFPKIYVKNLDVPDILKFLKENAEFDFDRLNTIIAVDLKDKIELIYDLFSTYAHESVRISTYSENNSAQSVINIYKSAYFDECEIYDLFGVKFQGNSKLKRLLLPKGWKGHPLLKNYEENDERLDWNK